MRKRVVIVLFMLLAVAALLFIVSCPDEPPGTGGQDDERGFTLEVVDKDDNHTLVLTPAVDQEIKVKIKLDDNTYLDTNSEEFEITIKWFHKEEPATTLSTSDTYKVTEDSSNKTLSVTVIVEDLDEKTWEASEKIVTVSVISVVDGGDGVSIVYDPKVGQILRANIELSDGTKIYTYPADPRVSYEWVYAESSSTILGTDGSYTVTSDNAGKKIAVFVTVAGIGTAEWVADSPVVAVERIEVVDGDDGVTPVFIPKVGQVIRANIKLSDGSYIYTHPEDTRVSYEWYYTEGPDNILGTEGSYTVTSDNIGKTIGISVTVDGLGEGGWEATGKVIEPIEYNGESEGPFGVRDGGDIEISLTGDYDVTIFGPKDTAVEDFFVFIGEITGDIEGNITVRVNDRGVNTLYGVITDSDATDELRFVGYLDEDDGKVKGEFITGPPLEPVTSITVKDSQGSETLTVKKGGTIDLIAETAPAGATTTVFWSIKEGGIDGEIVKVTKNTGKFTADPNNTGDAIIVVKTYDDSNLSEHEVTITVTN